MLISAKADAPFKVTEFSHKVPVCTSPAHHRTRLGTSSPHPFSGRKACFTRIGSGPMQIGNDLGLKTNRTTHRRQVLPIGYAPSGKVQHVRHSFRHLGFGLLLSISCPSARPRRYSCWALVLACLRNMWLSAATAIHTSKRRSFALRLMFSFVLDFGRCNTPHQSCMCSGVRSFTPIFLTPRLQTDQGSKCFES